MIKLIVDPFPVVAQLDDLRRKAWGDDVASYGRELERSLVHVGAMEGAKLVGFVNVAWDGGQHGFILDTCVDPEHQRQGIAVRMVQQAAEVARQRGAEWLHVDFEPHLEGFYRQCGFEPTPAGLMRLK
ncbi:GNAT family N-acetyltransferase [Devosia sp. SL43]|uniref:GNAT family N-acetyltransferase n=1 Tax=Devosia sp. SL43 TaxID=2806348 RepID=UPI001F41BF9E|nr:GNAT family N-acetyltransferase [Devosia sp. SL43]UJW86799.1 GNAT family N-acetyltransferase [Devosia sp. SL43]